MAVRHKIDDHTTHKKKRQQNKRNSKYICVGETEVAIGLLQTKPTNWQKKTINIIIVSVTTIVSY